MTVGPVTVAETSDVRHAADVFADNRWKSLPVLRGSRLVGVISRSDLVRALATSDTEIQSRVLDDFAAVRHEDWKVNVAEGLVTVRGPRRGQEARLAAAIVETTPGVRHVLIEPHGVRSTGGGELTAGETGLELRNRHRWPRGGRTT